MDFIKPLLRDGACFLTVLMGNTPKYLFGRSDGSTHSSGATTIQLGELNMKVEYLAKGLPKKYPALVTPATTTTTPKFENP